MNKKYEISNVIWGIIGIILLCVFHNNWGILPAIGVALTSVVFIRSDSKDKELTEQEKKVRLIKNIVSVVCWIIASVLCYIFADKLKSRGLWFVLASYIFFGDTRSLVSNQK